MSSVTAQFATKLTTVMVCVPPSSPKLKHLQLILSTVTLSLNPCLVSNTCSTDQQYYRTEKYRICKQEQILNPVFVKFNPKLEADRSNAAEIYRHNQKRTLWKEIRRRVLIAHSIEKLQVTC